MEIVTATTTTNRRGGLMGLVDAFTAAQGAVLAGGVTEPSDWDPVAEYVSADFKRVGAYLEELDWEAYKVFLTGWARGGTQFEFTVFHFTEVGDTVFQEIEERHCRGDQFIRKNVMAVYRFTPEGKLRHLDIYEQAKDSGRWIAEAADAARSAG